MPRLPTYEYHCDSCDQNFDVVQSFHDDALTACPTCGSPVRKVFGNVGIVFKGSGFYKTDSRAKSSTKAPSGEASTPSGDGSGDSTSSATSSDSASKSSTSDTSSSSAPASGGEKTASKPTPKAPSKDKGGDSKSKA
jgi:putative FmdB family regulatory protein